VRAGGKHNDLDNVGYTARHHTFFEMLGNFSFGDYFKEQAISHAWELLTGTWGIAKEKLCVTVYHTDDEAAALWKKIAGLPEEKIIRISTNDNFWAMGDTGPCGPCSEIFYDHGDKIPGGLPGSADQDGDRFIEIWNLVFMQYEQKDKDTRVSLPKPSIDTGMGLERITAVLQGVHDNYDIDLFQTLIRASEELSKNKNAAHAVSHRVIADHLRSSSFLIADGVLPSNEGRGYVLRRIMRRAMRHAHMLGCKAPLMHQLVPTLVGEMGTAYPELKRAEANIIETLKLEEEKFKETLERGLKLLDEEKAKLAKGTALPGAAAFKLYDTYGFPLDLTQDILRGENLAVDLDGFNAAMQEQKDRARAAWKGSGQSATASLWFDIKERVGATEFLGYSMEAAQGEIVALVRDGAEVSALNAGETGMLIVNQTPFYGESGGQVGDTGRVTTNHARASVSDTSKPLDGLHVHHLTVDSGTLRVGETVDLVVDTERRNRIRANHSATHLLHAALREKLGEHVTQKGSLVNADRLRFDVTNPKAIAAEEIAAVEALVNHYVAQASPTATKLMTQEEAVKSGAMALFGEKYGDEVRVLAMGKRADGRDFSVELCGGTHVSPTPAISARSNCHQRGLGQAGVRRIEAVTGQGALDYIAAEERRLDEAADLLGGNPAEIGDKLRALLDRQKKLERELEGLKAKAANAAVADLAASAVEVGGIRVLAARVEGLDAKALRDAVDNLKQQLRDAVVLLAGAADGKVALIAGVSGAALGSIKAGELLAHVAGQIGGKGGGRPDMAQGGGEDGPNLRIALEGIQEWVSGRLRPGA
jgi:alanyl-tRNA synthetase